MVSVDSETGQKCREPLVTLGEMRGSTLTFGVHASVDNLSSIPEKLRFVRVNTLTEAFTSNE